MNDDAWMANINNELDKLMPDELTNLAHRLFEDLIFDTLDQMFESDDES